MLHGLTDRVSTRRGAWVTLLVWIVLAGALIPLLPTLSDVTENDPLTFLPDNAESTRAAELVRERYPTSGTPAIIVFRNESGLTDADYAAAEEVYTAAAAMQQEAESNVGGIVSIFNIPQARADLVSPDGTAMTLLVTITGSSTDEAFAERVDALREVTEPFDSNALQVKVSGPGGLISDLVSVFAEIDVFLLLVTAVLVLVLLILIYRSPVVAFVPLLIVGVVFQLAGGLAAAVLRAVDFPINGQSSGIMTVILFGAGTDYYLFIASRYREELQRHEQTTAAMRATMRGVSEAILSAGGTLIAASLLLLLADLGSYRSLGPVIAIAIAVMMLAAITLVPAVLVLIGRNGFWPFRPQYDAEAAARGDATRDSRIWKRVAHTVLERPAQVLIGTSVVMLLLIGGMVFFKPSYDSLESLPSSVESVEGFEALRQSFPQGDLAPSSIYIAAPDGGSIYDPTTLAAVQAISDAVRRVDGVVRVEGAASPYGVDGPGPDAITAAVTTIPPDLVQAITAGRAEGSGGPPPGSEDIDPDSDLAQAIGLYVASLGYVSADGQIARLAVVLDENPYGVAAMDLIPALRDAARDAAETQGLDPTQILIGGETAENADTRSANTRDELVVLPVVLLAIMLILGLLLRSVLPALYLGATIVLTYFATLGLSVLVFRFVFGQESVGSSMPFLLFIFLNALGVDYSIYLMTRVREESRHLPLRLATERALVRTGGVITSAGIILAGTFAALMTLPLRDLFQLGFAVAIGVLIDTFITRSLLVPSIVELLGKYNWWPNRDRMAEVEHTAKSVSGADRTPATDPAA